MREALGKVAGSILRSLFISIVMFVVVFSVITGEFPPDFSRIKKGYQSLQQMAQLSRQIHQQHKILKAQNDSGQAVDDADVEALQELNLKRAELGASLLGEGPLPQTAEVTQLQNQIKELQAQLFRLQDRVNKLEERVK